LNALVDVSREILSSYGHEDPLEHGKQWGMIQNEHVKRRKTTRPPPPAPAPVPAAPKPSSTTQEPSQKNDSDQGAASKPPSQQRGEGKAENPPPQRKKGDLFSSFAKTKPKAKTENAAGAEAVSTSHEASYCFN
jgi:DNA polymerase delta subunit 3